MAHHKRRRPKHQRAGCLMCKPWKDERNERTWLKPSVKRHLQEDDENGRTRKLTGRTGN